MSDPTLNHPNTPLNGENAPPPSTSPIGTKGSAQKNPRSKPRAKGSIDPAVARIKKLKLLAKKGLSELDDVSQFDLLYAQLEKEWEPFGQNEKFLVRRIALLQIKLATAAMVQAEYIGSVLNPRVIETPADRLESNRLVLQFLLSLPDKKEITEADIRAALSQFETIVKEEGFPARLAPADLKSSIIFHRHESALATEFYRALKELGRLQRERPRRKSEISATASRGQYRDQSKRARSGRR